MSKETLLIVDDEGAQLATLAGYLKKQGFNILTAENGNIGLDIVKSKTVDLVLTDMRMPEKNGLELLRDINKINPEISIIVMTAYGNVEDAVTAMKAGADDYLQKPIDLPKVKQSLPSLQVTSLVSQAHGNPEFSGQYHSLSVSVSVSLSESVSVSVSVSESVPVSVSVSESVPVSVSVSESLSVLESSLLLSSSSSSSDCGSMRPGIEVSKQAARRRAAIRLAAGAKPRRVRLPSFAKRLRRTSAASFS